MSKLSLSPFSSELPTLQLAWDSTSLSLAQECWRKYYYMMILNYWPAGMNIHLDFGIAYHTIQENFQKDLFAGAEREEAVLNGVRSALCWDDSPHIHDKNYTYKNRHTLARTFEWYTEQYRDDSYKILEITDPETNQKGPAVELSFSIDLGLPAPGGDSFFLCGHLDSAGIFQDDLYFADHKTTKSPLDERYFAGFNPDTQMTNYFAASKVIFKQPAKGGIVDAAQLLVNGSRFGRRIVHRTPSQMDEWQQDLHWWLLQAQQNAEREHWPMNTNSCDNFGGCAFRGICAKDPSVRRTFLAAEFEKRVWNPLETRGAL